MRWSIVFILPMIAIVHGQYPGGNNCSNIDCGAYPSQATCPGRLLENSSQNGCCATCFVFIDDEMECSVLFSSMEVSYSLKYVTMCQPHSVCSYNMCIPVFKDVDE